MKHPILKFEEITVERKFSIPELSESAAKNVWREDKKQYRVWLDDQEAAFVTFDTFWPDQLNLYEVVVAKAFRRRGVGSSVIRFAVNLARQMGKARLTVRVGKIGEQTKEEIKSFYLHRGLRPSPNDADLFEIDVVA